MKEITVSSKVIRHHPQFQTELVQTHHCSTTNAPRRNLRRQNLRHPPQTRHKNINLEMATKNAPKHKDSDFSSHLFQLIFFVFLVPFCGAKQGSITASVVNGRSDLSVNVVA